MEVEENLTSAETLVQNQKKEKKILQAKIQALKHGIPKGDKKKKKDVMAEVLKLESDLKEKHDREYKELTIDKDKSEIESQDHEVDENNLQISDETNRVSKAQRRKDKKAMKEKEREESIAQQEEENVRGVRNIEAQKLKKIVTERGLFIYEVPSDGNCMYKAIEHQLTLQSIIMDSDELRQQTAQFMRNHPDDFMPFLTSRKSGDAMTPVEFEKFCDDTAHTSVWGGQLELRALSHILKIPIEVVQAEGAEILIGEEYKTTKPLCISYHRHAFRSGEHYNSLAFIPKEIENHDVI